MMPAEAEARTTQLQQQQLCRLCAEPRDSLVGILEPEGQKLAIQAKIIKCLHIQICENDCLPLFVCFDCYMLLNQYNEFYEKTNQAQYSLCQMLLLDSKVPMQQTVHSQTAAPTLSTSNLETNFDSADNITDFSQENHCKDEFNSEINKNCVTSNINDDNDPHQTNNMGVKKEEPRNTESNILPKHSKKKIKRKNNFLEIDESELQDFLSVQLNEENNKKYSEDITNDSMKGAESSLITTNNVEIKVPLEQNSKAEQKVNQKKKNNLDRYPWLCADCNDKLPSLEALEEHHETVHNQKAKYMCVQCCKVYEKYYGFLTHVKRHKTKTRFSCDDCGKTFVHKKVLDTHKAIHSEERPHICQTCGKSFRQQSALYIHSRCHLPENIKNRYPCDQCDKRFSTKPNLVTHKRIHSGVRNFTCDQCGKSFIQKGNLEAHFLTHSSDKPHNCLQCSKAFKTLLQLKKHETVHTGAKPHQCDICGRSFREKGTLREHHRIHTGAMPFSCEFCGKCFRFKGILTTHRRQHTGERPYSCLECQHHFTNWPNYNKHMKRRHGINTSHNKLIQPSQQQQQEGQQHLQTLQQTRNQQQQPPPAPVPVLPQIANQSFSNTNINGVSQLDSQNTSATVQVIQTVPQMSETTQSIVLQTLPSNATVTTTPTFTETEQLSAATSAVPIAHQRQQKQQHQTDSIQQAATSISFRERQHGTSYFNAIGTTYLPPSLSYNFYNVPNVIESDLIHPR